MPPIDRAPRSDNRPGVLATLALTLVLSLSACGGGDAPVAQPQATTAREAPAQVQGAPIYRFAKISSGAYFYTGSQWEADYIRDHLPDFRDEGIAFYQSDEATGTPVYRFANTLNGGYFYTASAWERDNTIANYPHMRYEGSTFSVAPEGDPQALPVYRLANLLNGAYLYTTSPEERDAAVALGFWRDEGSTFSALTVPPVTLPAFSLYAGIAVEDRFNNPEDPTIGTVFMHLPVGDGSFQGQMPFTFIGCTDGADIGQTSGVRTGNTLTGNWSGTMDGHPVGGNFTATWDAAAGRFAGTATNAAGKQPVQVGPCHYHVASTMALQLYNQPVSQPEGFRVTANDGLTPRLTWPMPSLGLLTYGLRLFDEGCLEADIRNEACFLGETFTAGEQLLFRVDIGSTPGLPAQLQAGHRYLLILTAQDAATGELKGLAIQRLQR